MAFEATDRVKKKGGAGTFEATSNMRFDESYAARRKNETSRALSEFYKRYDSDMADNAKFFSGEGSRLDRLQASGYKYSSQQYKDEASKLLSGLERDRGFMSAEEYLAHAQILNGIINQDTTEYDKQINDLWGTKLSMGGNDAYRKVLEIYRTNSRLGLSSNPTYSEVEKLLGGDTLNDSDREYLENIKKSPELIDTMSADEIGEKRRGDSDLYSQQKEELTAQRDEYLKKIAVLKRSAGLSDPTERKRLEKKVKELDSKISEIDRRYEENSIAYYNDNGAVSWTDLEYNKRLSSAFESIANPDSETYNKEAASAYARLRDLDADRETVYKLDSQRRAEFDIDHERHVLKQGLSDTIKKATGYNYDDIQYYVNMQKDAEKKAEVDETIGEIVRGANKIPVVGKAAGLGAAIAAIPGSLLSGFDYLDNAIQSIGHSNADDMSTYRPINTSDDWATNAASGIIGSQTRVYDEALQEIGVSDGWRKFWTSTYGGFASGINSLATVAGSCALFGPEAGQVVASVILSGQAASSSVQEAVQNGSTTKEALEYGFASGVAEYLGEKISIGSLVDKFLNSTIDTSGVKNFFKSFGKSLPKMLGQGAVEGSEEVFTSLMNTFADAAINGDHTQLKNSVQKYINSGMSEEEAKTAAFKDYMVDIAEQAWGGFVGGVMGGTAATLAGGVRSVGNSVKNAAYNHVDNLQTGADALRRFDSPAALSEHIKNELGLSEENYNKLFESADKVSKIKDKDGKYSSRSYRKAGKLTAEAEAAIMADMPNVARSEIQQELTLRGMDKGDSEKYAGYINDKFFGKEVDADAKKAISENEIAAGLFKELGTFDEENGSDFKAYLKDAVIRKAAEKINEFKNYGRSEENGFHVSDVAPTDDTGISQTAKNSELRISGEIGEVVGENEKGEVTVSLDGKTVPLNRVNFQSNAEAVLYSFAKDMSADSANDMIAQAKKTDMTAESISAFASAWKLAYDMGYAKRSIDTTLRALQGYSLSKEQIKLAHARGAIADAKYQENEIRKMKEQTRGRGRGNVTYESGAKSKVTKEQQLIAEVLAEVGYNIKFENSADGANGSFRWGSDTITVNLGEGATELFGETLSHELVHSMKKESPELYGELTAYVAAEMGEDKFEAYVLNRQRAENMSYEDAVDETMARSLSEMLENSQALTRFAEKHMSIFEKIAKAMKNFITRISDAIKSLYGERSTLMPIEARELMRRAEKLQQVFDRALESTLDSVHDRAYDKTEGNKKSTSEERVQNSAKGEKKNFVEDKYFERQIQKWEGLNPTGYIRVGEITANSPLNLVGMPASSLYFDVSKITKAFEAHGDHLNADVMAQIPKLLNDPIVITEYKPGEHTNTVNVYGELVVNESPVVVGIVATLNLNGKNYINKVRTVHARRDFIKNINVSSVLYLNENEKKTKQWFQTWGQHVPASVTKFGLIRSIQLDGENVNSKKQNSSKEISTEFDKVQYSFRKYSDAQREQWKNAKRIVIYEDSALFSTFINQSVSDKSFNKKMYFGSIDKAFADKIYSNTKISVQNYNCSLSSNEIRKIFKDHGNEQKEVLRGQRAVTADDVLQIPSVILSADEITRSHMDYNGKPVINFIKNISATEKITVSAVVSNKHLDLFVQTSFINVKKGNLATPTGERAPINTPEANSGTVSNNNLSQHNVNVNSKKQNSSKEISTDRLIEALRETIETKEDMRILDEWQDSEQMLGEFMRQEKILREQIKEARSELPDNFKWATSEAKKLKPELRDKIERLEQLQDAQREMSSQIKQAERRLTQLSGTGVFNDLMRRVSHDTREQVTKRYSKQAGQRILSEEMKRIQKIHDKLTKMLLNPRPGAFVPKSLAGGVAKVLKIFDTNRMHTEQLETYNQKISHFTSRRDSAKKAGRTKSVEYYENQIAEFEKKKSRIMERNTGLSATLAEIRNEFDRLINDDDENSFGKTVSQELLNASDFDGIDKPIDEMTYKELVRVTNALTALETYISNESKYTVKGKEYSAANDARAAISETNNSMFFKSFVGRTAFKLNIKMLSPERAFSTFGGYAKGSVWDRLYARLDEGQLEQKRLKMEMLELFDPLVQNKDVSKLSSIEDAVEISFEEEDVNGSIKYGLFNKSGKPVKMTRAMMLSVLMHTYNTQNWRHLWRGGMDVPDMKMYYKNDGKSAYAMGDRIAGHMSAYSGIYQELDVLRSEAESDSLTPMQRREKYRELKAKREELLSLFSAENDARLKIQAHIEGILTEYEKEWIKEAKNFFDNVSKKHLNKTSVDMYGFEKAVVNNYFPIVTDPKFRDAAFDDVSRDVSLENMGNMKSRTGASNPLMLEDITKVIDRQINNVSKYCGLMPAIADFKRVYNKRFVGSEESVMNALETKFGVSATKYISNLIADLQGARSSESGLLDMIRGNTAAAVLTLNVPVTFAQTASYPTAAAVVGWKALRKALPKVFTRVDFDLIKKWSPLMWVRNNEGSDITVADMNKVRSSSYRRKQINNKLKWLTGWITMADTKTVGTLWYAAEYYVQDNFTTNDYKKGTDKYYMKVAEVFNEIVEKTQPNYTMNQECMYFIMAKCSYQKL